MHMLKGGRSGLRERSGMESDLWLMEGRSRRWRIEWRVVPIHQYIVFFH